MNERTAGRSSGDTGMSGLERRYRRLLRAYPAAYRRDRGEEIVGTYLDLAGPDRRWPSPADAADLMRGGLRQRLRAAGATDLIPGVRLAALLALTTAAFLAAFWMVGELRPPPADWGLPRFGPFVSVGVLAWIAWLPPALLALVAPGRPTRVAVAVAVLATVAVPAVSVVGGLPRPPLLALVPQAALGLLALAADARPALPARALPAAAAITGAVSADFLTGHGSYWGWYGWSAEQLLPGTGGALLGIAALLTVGLAMRQDWRGLWAVVALLTPVGLLNVHILAGMVDGLLSGAPRPTYPTMVGAAIVVGVLGPLLLPLAVVLRCRWPRPAAGAPAAVGMGDPPDRCPTCGRSR